MIVECARESFLINMMDKELRDKMVATNAAALAAKSAIKEAAARRITDFSINAIMGNSIGQTAASKTSQCGCTNTIGESHDLKSTNSNNDLVEAIDLSCTFAQQVQRMSAPSEQQPIGITLFNGSQTAPKKPRPKKYKCPYCWVALSNTGQFKGHIRIHTGERPFKCDQPSCQKTFTRNEELTRHKRIHTGQRPYGCSVCKKCFGRKDHLKKHTRTHEKHAQIKMF